VPARIGTGECGMSAAVRYAYIVSLSKTAVELSKENPSVVNDLMSLILVHDSFDLHGLSAGAVGLISGMLTQPATIKDVNEKLAKILQSAPEGARIIIADIPLSEQVIGTIKNNVRPRQTIIIVDHHIQTQQLAHKLKEAMKGTGAVAKVDYVPTAYEVNKQVPLYSVFSRTENDKKAIEFLAKLGSVADLEPNFLCGENRDEELLKLVLYLDFEKRAKVKSDGDALELTQELARIALNESLRREYIEKAKSYKVPNVEKLTELAGNESVGFIVEKDGSLFKQFGPTFNKLVAITTSFINKYKALIAVRHGFNPRVGKKQLSIALYLPVCAENDARELLKQIMPNARPIGHKTFAFVILAEGNEADEKYHEVIEIAQRLKQFLLNTLN